MSIAHTIFGVFGNVSGLFLFLVPIVTFKRIIAKKSTEEFSGDPYPMTLLNCLLSAWYGLPFVSPNNILVTIINGVGAMLEFVYVFIFIYFADGKNGRRARVLGLFAFAVVVFTSVVLISLFALHDNSRKIFCGFAAAIFSMVMYASPLSKMFDVIKSKSVEFMPFFLSLGVFICGTSWFIYGLLGHDLFVAVPNGVGSALGAVQLILYFTYRDNKGNPNKPSKTQENSMEMGTAKPPSSSKAAVQSHAS